MGSKIVDDYDATSGVTRRATKAVDGKQANDPKKLAQAFLKLANAEKLPFRFTAGADAVAIFEQVLASKRQELDQWRDLSVSLAHDQQAHGEEPANPMDTPRGTSTAADPNKGA
jgi:hypothetical protein